MNVCLCALRHLRGLGCLCLVCLEFLASFHLHGAVDNPVGSQRLQPLHFHDHHLGSTDIIAGCCRPGVIHLFQRGQRGKKRIRNRHEAAKSFHFIYFTHSMPATVTMYSCSCSCSCSCCIKTFFMTYSRDDVSYLKYSRHYLNCWNIISHIICCCLNCLVTTPPAITTLQF